MNNPLILTDPTGLQAGSCPAGVPGTGCAVVEEVIRVITILFTRRDFLLNGATNMSNLDAANFERAQNRMNAVSGDPDAIDALDRRVVGNRGPTVDAVIQQTTDAVDTSMTIIEASIAVNSLLLMAPVPRGSATVTSNRGLAISGLSSSETSAETAATRATGNRFTHIFDKPDHNLDSLVNQFGSRENTFNAVQQAANQALRNGTLVVGNNGILPTGDSGPIINVGGAQVRLIGGRVIDGTVQISSFSRRGL